MINNTQSNNTQSNNTQSNNTDNKELKIEYKGSCFFFIYHNNIPKYITIPQYTIEYSQDVKIKMGHIITYKIFVTHIKILFRYPMKLYCSRTSCGAHCASA